MLLELEKLGLIKIKEFVTTRDKIEGEEDVYRKRYGYEHNYYYNDDGELIIEPQKIENHIHGSKIIPSGFFSQSDVENISGILFTSSGTISKFSRMAIQSGFGVKNIKTYRTGFSYNKDPHASLPNRFHYEVTERSTETWAEGLDFYHNPNAKIPLDPDIFPTIAHHFLKEDGNIESWIPDFHPYASITSHIKQSP